MRALQRAPIGRARHARARMSITELSVLLALWLLLATRIFQETTGLVTLLTIGPYQMGVQEPAFVCCLIAAALCLFERRPPISLLLVSSLAFMSCIAIAFFRGITLDVFEAIVWLRAYGIIPPAIIIGLCFRPNETFYRRIFYALLQTASALTILCILRAAFGAQLFYLIKDVSADTVNDDGRVIASSGALLIALASILMLSHVKQRITLKKIPSYKLIALFIFFAAAAVLTRQGTVLFSLIIGIAAIMFLESRYHSIRVAKVTALLAMVIMTYGAINVIDWDSTRGNSDRTNASNRSGNMAVRRNVWDASIREFETRQTIDKALGVPAGERREVWLYLNGAQREWMASLHSAYYGTMSMFGYAGLFTYCIFLAVLLYTCILKKPAGSKVAIISPAFGVSATLMVMMYGFSYELRGSDVIFIILPMIAGSPLLSARSRQASSDHPHIMIPGDPARVARRA